MFSAEKLYHYIEKFKI